MRKAIEYYVDDTASHHYAFVKRKLKDRKLDDIDFEDAEFEDIGTYFNLSRAKQKIISDFKDRFGSKDFYVILHFSRRVYEEMNFVMKDISYEEFMNVKVC